MEWSAMLHIEVIINPKAIRLQMTAKIISIPVGMAGVLSCLVLVSSSYL